LTMWCGKEGHFRWREHLESFIRAHL
jgi:hypothetical protein